MIVSLKTFFKSAIALTIPTSLCSAPTLAADLSELNGNWESISCEVRPQVGQDGKVTEWWLTRKIEMKDGRIVADFTTYAGPGCDVPLQVLGFAGSVTKVGESDVTVGAINADLKVDEYVRFTPIADGFARFLNSAPAGTCGAAKWEVGTTQNVHVTGCSVIGLKPNDPTVEFEVLAVQDDKLYFGARPVDGTFITSVEKRPHALQVPLKRSN
ncbi:MAG: hypothetical protein AAF468_10410 [Pseudomonadota bacterium]